MSIKLILPCDGTDNSTTFVDDSPISNTVTAHGTAKIISNAAVFDGVGGTYLSFPDTSDFDFSGDFTIRFRVKLSAFNPNYSLMLSQSGTVYAGIGFGLFIEINDSGNLYACVSYNGTSPAFYTNLSMPCQLYVGTWHEVSIEAFSGNLYVYRDTVRLGSVPLTSPIYHDSSRTFHLGGTPSLNVGLIGSLDQIYINNGEALSQGDTSTSSISVAVVGQGLSSVIGISIPSANSLLTGQNISSEQGNLLIDTSVTITEQNVNVTQTNVKPVNNISLVGSEISLVQGSMSLGLSNDLTIDAIGQEIRLSIGSVTPVLHKDIIGEESSLTHGIIFNGVSVTSSVNQITFTQGNHSVNVSLNSLGQTLLSHKGILTIHIIALLNERAYTILAEDRIYLILPEDRGYQI